MAKQTINSLPGADANFMSDLLAFLTDEFASRANKYAEFSRSIFSGGIGSVDVSLTHAISACTGFPNGYYVSQDSVSHTYTATKDTYVFLRDDDSRVIAITGYTITYDSNLVFAEYNSGSTQPQTPFGCIPLFKAITDGTSITTITDLRKIVTVADPSETDQGVTASGSGLTLYDIAQDITASINVTIIYFGNLLLDTSLDLSSFTNLHLFPQQGSLIEQVTGDETLTLYSPSTMNSSPHNQIFSGNPVVFSIPGTVYPNWWGAKPNDSTECINSIRYSISSISSVGGKIKFNAGTYRFGAYIDGVDPYKLYCNGMSNFSVQGSGPETILKPNWNGVTYNPGTDGYLSLWFVNCDHFEVSDFTYDNWNITDVRPSFLRIEDSSNANIHHLYAKNGNDIQDKSAISLYNSSYVNVHDCRIENFDVGVLLANSLSGRNNVTNNQFIGGRSEAVSIYTDSSEGSQSYVDRTTIVANNYAEGKGSYAFICWGANNAGVVFNGNTVVGHRSGAFHVAQSSGVSIVGNKYSGGFYFISLTNAKNIGVSSNVVFGARSFILQVDDVDYIENLNVCANTYIGPAEADAYSAALLYKPGQSVGYGGNFYFCILQSIGHLPTNTTYWTKFINDKIIGGYYRDSSFCDNIFKGGLSVAFYLTEPNNIKVGKNTTSSIFGIDVNGSSNGYIEKLEIIDNDIVATTGPALEISGYGIKNSNISRNSFKSDIDYGVAIILNTIIQNVTYQTNYHEGAAGELDLYAETIGCTKKSGNSWSLSPTKHWKDYATNGYVTIGDTFPNAIPAAGGTEGYVCTTAGYGYKESYDTSHSYVTGEHVLGSDGNVYYCILADSGAAANAPITGGSYATYWALAGTAAVFKAYGTIAA